MLGYKTKQCSDNDSEMREIITWFPLDGPSGILNNTEDKEKAKEEKVEQEARDTSYESADRGEIREIRAKKSDTYKSSNATNNSEGSRPSRASSIEKEKSSNSSIGKENLEIAESFLQWAKGPGSGRVTYASHIHRSEEGTNDKRMNERGPSFIQRTKSLCEL